MQVLVIGGTRNLGPSIIRELLKQGHRVTVFHRGMTAAQLPHEVEILHGDRSDRSACARILGTRAFDAVVDTTLYNARDAQHAVEIFGGRIGRYIFLSTGQVYLVRTGVSRPFREEDYPGDLIAEPPREHHFDHENWLYGIEKRGAEDVFAEAAAKGFPVTVLRLPMVNSERDHFHRILGYLLRLWDGAPVLIPDDEGLPLRHIYGEDVVAAILVCLAHPRSTGRAFNISQEETVSLREFLELLGEYAGAKPNIARVSRGLLESAALLPECSAFSDPWMSSLANERSKMELGMAYTPMTVYLRALVEHYRVSGCKSSPGYEQRKRELEFAQHHGF